MFHFRRAASLAKRRISSLRAAPPTLLPFSLSTRNYSSAHRTVSLIPGDGIGTEISEAVVKIFKHAQVPLTWEHAEVNAKDGITEQALKSLEKNRVGLKGPLGTPIGKGHKSMNLGLRKALSLYANVRPSQSVPGVKTPYEDVDLVIIRENTEGEYSGIEHTVVPGVAQSLKVITAEASLKVAKFAFNFADKNGRKKVSAVHKATVMSKSDGLFLACCREVALQYPHITFEEVSLDNVSLFLPMTPERYDVLVLPNLYGDIISDLGAGLIGGLGLTPSGNIGDDGMALFEAVHGTAPDIAGKNLANPTALLFSAVMMLDHLDLQKYGKLIKKAALHVLKEGKHVTKDLKGDATCSGYTEAIMKAIDDIRDDEDD